MVLSEEILVHHGATKIALSSLDQDLYFGFPLWRLPDSWSTWLEMHRFLTIEFQQNKMAEVLRETDFTIDDLVLNLDELDELVLCGMFFGVENVSVSLFEHMMKGEVVEDDHSLLKEDSFSYFVMTDDGLMIYTWISTVCHRRSGDSGFDTDEYRNYIELEKKPFPLEELKWFKKRFIIAAPM